MSWPEPSLNDHLAPWNEEIDEDGDTICGCSSCKRRRREQSLEDYGYGDYLRDLRLDT